MLYSKFRFYDWILWLHLRFLHRGNNMFNQSTSYMDYVYGALVSLSEAWKHVTKFVSK